MADKADDSSGCGCSILILIGLVILFHTQPWFWIVIGIIVTIFVIIAIIGSLIPTSEISSQTQASSSNNQASSTSPSTNASSDNIQWTEIGTYYSTTSSTSGQTDNATVDNDFLNGRNQNVNIDELLLNLIGQKDRVSGDAFHQGEKVYLCVPCQLGYHEESWQFLDRTCDQCKSSNVRMYNLPLTCVQETNKATIVETFSIDADDFLRWGLEKAKKENYSVAIKDFTEALRLNPINPKNAEISYNRGLSYDKLRNYNQAIEDYNEAIINLKNNNNPDNAKVYNNRGNARYKLGDIQGAIEDYNQALRIYPSHTLAKKNLDIARSKLENTQQARTNANSRTSTATEVYEEYISALNLDTIRQKVGQTISVKGQIRSVRVDKDSQIIYFDFDENTFRGFYAYVLAKNCHNFPNPTIYFEKNVVVSGMISLNRRNQPRIILNHTSQLRNV